MPTDDYYRLIGVPADADRNEIRDAYRARRAELGDDEAGRANAARLNRAWNVLSDPAQRERYDDQLATARADGDEIVVPEIVDAATTNGSGKRTRSGRNETNRRPPRQRVELLDEINGVPLASTRDRMFALVIDGFLCVLILALLSGVAQVFPGFAFQMLAKNQHPAVVAKVNDLTDQLNATQRRIDDVSAQRKKAPDNKTADRKNCTGKPGETTGTSAQALLCQQVVLQKKYDAIKKQISSEQKKLTGVLVVSLIASFVVLMLVFAVPTALTGRTPGKAIRKIRMVRESDTGPVGWGTALRHYGLLFSFLLVAGMFLGPIGFVIVAFGVTSFYRNPKRQGWDNRISHTVVIAQ